MKSTKLVSLVSFAVVASVASNSILAASHGKDDDIELYGEIEVRSVNREAKDLDTFVDKARMGLKGAHVLNNMSGTKARWQIEYNLPVNSNALSSTDTGSVSLRKANVSLQGDFGEFIFGRQNNILADTKKIDTFKNDSGTFLFTPDRVGNAISYVTPTMGGFHGYIQLATDTQPTVDNDSEVDATIFGINYSDDTFYFGISRFDSDNEYPATELGVTSLGFSVSFGDFSVFGTYQDEEDDTQTYGLGVGLSMNDWTFKTGVNGFKSDNDGPASTIFKGSVVAPDGNDDEGNAVFFLAEYALGKGVSTFAQYVYYDDDAEDETFGGSAFSVGIAADISRTLM
ncbi:porin [Endozoicomonas sp. SM1973]|uniref:Porin n=1 Tax=Spartinivicinus marinus TaxID=2994442 RepID=A0A853I8F3_9GAMM|nr:porin [Spartinivicinus marinus]MCX4029691.1 porin [Spartinivicinus marinus]NYZ66928.1 porin [Spartinivicinus marinus]